MCSIRVAIDFLLAKLWPSSRIYDIYIMVLPTRAYFILKGYQRKAATRMLQMSMFNGNHLPLWASSALLRLIYQKKTEKTDRVIGRSLLAAVNFTRCARRTGYTGITSLRGGFIMHSRIGFISK